MPKKNLRGFCAVYDKMVCTDRPEVGGARKFLNGPCSIFLSKQ